MKEEIFNLLNTINGLDFDNSKFGFCRDIEDSAIHFGIRESVRLEGFWLALYLNEDSWEWEHFESGANKKMAQPDYEFLTGVEGEFLFLYKL